MRQKSDPGSADREEGDGSSLFDEGTCRRMFGWLTKEKLLLKAKLFTIRWYPSSRSCLKLAGKKRPPQQMPPLMVRKPEWRR